MTDAVSSKLGAARTLLRQSTRLGRKDTEAMRIFNRAAGVCAKTKRKKVQLSGQKKEHDALNQSSSDCLHDDKLPDVALPSTMQDRVDTVVPTALPPVVLDQPKFPSFFEFAKLKPKRERSLSDSDSSSVECNTIVTQCDSSTIECKKMFHPLLRSLSDSDSSSAECKTIVTQSDSSTIEYKKMFRRFLRFVDDSDSSSDECGIDNDDDEDKLNHF